MRRRGLHGWQGQPSSRRCSRCCLSVSTASADVVHLKIKEGRTVLDPGSNTVIADAERDGDEALHVAAHPRRDRRRRTTRWPTAGPAHGLTLPSDVLKTNGGNTADAGLHPAPSRR